MQPHQFTQLSKPTTPWPLSRRRSPIKLELSKLFILSSRDIYSRKGPPVSLSMHLMRLERYCQGKHKRAKSTRITLRSKMKSKMEERLREVLSCISGLTQVFARCTLCRSCVCKMCLQPSLRSRHYASTKPTSHVSPDA